MSDKITLDRKTFKVLAADTRIEIIKAISEHKLTLTDLSEKFEMSPSTIKEHLDKLVDAGLIKADERGMKWKYYSLTSKGENIVSPVETKVWILLGTSVLMLFASGFTMMKKLFVFSKESFMSLGASREVISSGAAEMATPTSTLTEPVKSFAARATDETVTTTTNAAVRMLKTAADTGSEGVKELEAKAVGNAAYELPAKALDKAVAQADAIVPMAAETTEKIVTTTTTLLQEVPQAITETASSNPLDIVFLFNLVLFSISLLGICFCAVKIVQKKRKI